MQRSGIPGLAVAVVHQGKGATVVATQVGQGVVRWDTPVKEKLPWFALDTPEASNAVTIGDLHSHQPASWF